MSKSPQCNQQTEPKECKPEDEEKSIYQNLESGSHSIGSYSYLKVSSGFNARKNPKEQYLKVVTFSDASFNKKRIYFYDHAA